MTPGDVGRFGWLGLVASLSLPSLLPLLSLFTIYLFHYRRQWLRLVSGADHHGHYHGHGHQGGLRPGGCGGVVGRCRHCGIIRLRLRGGGGLRPLLGGGGHGGGGCGGGSPFLVVACGGLPVVVGRVAENAVEASSVVAVARPGPPVAGHGVEDAREAGDREGRDMLEVSREVASSDPKSKEKEKEGEEREAEEMEPLTLKLSSHLTTA